MRLIEFARSFWRRDSAKAADESSRAAAEVVKPFDTLREAKEKIARGDLADAIGLFRRVIASGEHISEGQYGLGIANLRLGRTEEALAALTAAMNVEGPHPEAPLRLAEFAIAENRDDDALCYIRRALAIKSEYAEAYLALGKLEARLGRTDEAVAALTAAMNAADPSPEAPLRLAEIALDENREADALFYIRRSLAIKPDFAEAYLALGKLEARFGRSNEAVAALTAAMNAADPSPEAPLRLAEIALDENREADALVYIRRALAIKPDFAEAYLALGKLEARLGDGEEAGRCYHRAFELSKSLEPGLRYGEWLLANGDPIRAQSILRAVRDRAPCNAEAEYWTGVAALEFGDIEEANAAFGRALQINPDYAEANSAAAFCSMFPHRRVLPPARAMRQTICVPAMQFRSGWLGGQIYLLNFARTVSLLPKAIRPRLVVIVMNDWRERAGFAEIMHGLIRCQAVVAVFAESGEPVFANPMLQRYFGDDEEVRRVRHRKLFSSVEWTFPVLYPSWGIATLPRPIYWIPDFQHRFWPGYFSAVEVVARDRDIGALAARSVPIVFSSCDAHSHFERFYPEHRSRGHVWHFHTAPEPPPATRDCARFRALNLPKRFYYTPNQFWPHKNHETLFHGLRLVLDRGFDVSLVCTGTDLYRSSDPYHLRLLELIKTLNLEPHLRLLGVLSRGVQLELFRRACAIVQPTLFEGWSTVIEDARALGRPMIVSDIPVHREQIGSKAVFFAAHNPAALAEAIAQLDATLLPGPDSAQEAAAAAALRGALADSAVSFMRILTVEEERTSGDRTVGS